MPLSLPVIHPLVDGQRRHIRYLRVSLTDRCNYRCTYCMPEEGVELLPRQSILTFEEIIRLVRIFAGLGVRRIRLTGGEPTIRRHVVDLVASLAAVPGIEQLVMTTNGHRLPDLARPLAEAGLAEVNVSVDTLDAEHFAALTRRGDLARVLAGIEAALDAGLKVKLNAVAMRGENEGQLGALCEYAWERGIVPRFIEHMPMSGGALYRSLNHLSAAEIRRRIAAHFDAELAAVADDGVRGPARYWQLGQEPDRRFGIISAMSEHFCSTCNRVRLSSAGELHTCLAYDDATNLRAMVRGEASDDEIASAIEAAVQGKRDGHDFHISGDGAPSKHMVSIGG